MKKTKKNITLDTLASMVASGFGDLEAKIEKRFSALEQGQEDIKLKLDNVAYRFELVELQRRVQLLEKRIAARR